MKRFRDKLVMVTGGNSGIGRGIVHRFAAEGAKVALVGRDPDKGRSVEGEVRDQGGEAVFFACDLTEEAAVKTLVQQVEKLGPLAIVVNNAGLGGRRTPIARDDGPGTRWEKFEGLLVRTGASRHQARREERQDQAARESHAMSCRTNVHQTKSSRELQGGGQREDRRQRQAVVEPDSRLSEWRMSAERADS